MSQNKNYVPTSPITQHFITITDPRLEHNKAHPLIDIIMVAICGVIAGADTWVDIEYFGKTHGITTTGLDSIPW